MFFSYDDQTKLKIYDFFTKLYFFRNFRNSTNII